MDLIMNTLFKEKRRYAYKGNKHMFIKYPRLNKAVLPQLGLDMIEYCSLRHDFLLHKNIYFNI